MGILQKRVWMESGRIRASGGSWTFSGTIWRYQIQQYIKFQRFSIGLISVECEGQSLASMPWSSQKCLHILIKWGQCHVLGGTQSSLYQRNVWKWVVLANAQKSVRPSINNPMPNPSCRMVLHTVSPDALTYDQRKPAFICEDNGLPVVASSGVL